MATASPVDARNDSSAIRMSRPMFLTCLAIFLAFFIDSEEWSSASLVRAQDRVRRHSNSYDSILVFLDINIGNPL